MRRRVPRFIGMTLGALAVLYLVWVIAATWFIRAGIYKVNDWNSEVTLSMGYAVSLWPGHLSGRDLRVVVHDSDVELDLQFDHFALDVDVAKLAEKKFVTTKTHLDGVKFYYRLTRPVPVLCKTKGLPPIGGQALPPPTEDCLQQSETALAPTVVSDPDELFQVDLSNIELTNVKDVWLESFRVQGRGTVSDSAFYLWPGQRIMVDARASDWTRVSATLDEKPVVEHGSVDVTLKIDEVSVKDNAALWRATSATIAVHEADGQLGRIDNLEGVYGFTGEATIDHGVPTSVAADGKVPALVAHVGKRRLTGLLNVRLRGSTGATPKTLHIVQGEAVLSNIAVDGRHFAEHQLKANILPGGVLATTTGVFNLEVTATCNSVAPALALLPPTFGAALTKLAVPDQSPLNIAIRIKGPWDHLVADPFTAISGDLEVAGIMAISPALKGTMKASLGPVSKTIEVD